jgi:hypothetical protein
MDFSNIANSVSVETDFVLGRQRSIFQMRSQNKVLILGIGDFAPTSKLRPGSTRTLLAGIVFPLSLLFV